MGKKRKKIGDKWGGGSFMVLKGHERSDFTCLCWHSYGLRVFVLLKGDSWSLCFVEFLQGVWLAVGDVSRWYLHCLWFSDPWGGDGGGVLAPAVLLVCVQAFFPPI